MTSKVSASKPSKEKWEKSLRQQTKHQRRKVMEESVQVRQSCSNANINVKVRISTCFGMPHCVHEVPYKLCVMCCEHRRRSEDEMK